MPLELLLIHGSPYAWRVQLALEHKGIPYQTRVLSMSQGELRTPQFLALNPRGRVPVLRDGELVLYESIAILAYLERRYPERPLFGASVEQSALIWRHISEYTAYVDHAVESFILPLYFGRAHEQAASVRDAIQTLTHELARYEAVLANSTFLAGPAPSAADFTLFPHVQSVLRAAGKPGAAAFELPFLPLPDQHPAVNAWLRRIERLPGYDSTYPPNWR
jgi:glutathione S-transferase